MKKYIPFILTGIFSTCLALGLFLLVGRKTIYVQSAPERTVLTNYSPFSSGATGGSAAAPDMVKASNMCKQAVVYIESKKSIGNYFSDSNEGISSGSGVIISADGYIATNRHVVADGNQFNVLTDDGRKYDAKLIGTDPFTDLALLKVSASPLPFLSFGNSDSLQVGEWVLAIGNPFRLYSTVTAGIVSAKARNINILDEGGIENFIQTDAAVNPGNSGGALVNTHGQLMGINTAIITYSGQYEGFSFAVPANLAKKVLEDIRKYGSSKRGWLGVVIRPVNDQVADEAGLTEVSGVVIDRITSGGAAELAGVRSQDIILTIDGDKITSSSDFMGKIGQHHPGDVLTLSVMRDHEVKTIKVKLSESRDGSTIEETPSHTSIDVLSDIGLGVRDLSYIEKNKLPKSGVLVNEIGNGSQVEKVNMEVNFIITRVNGVSVTNLEGFKKELQKSGTSLYLQGYYENFPGDFAYSITLD